MSSKERPRWETEDLGHPEEERSDIAWFNFEETVDPIGARIDYYGSVKGFQPPKNVNLSRAWVPSTAHTGYWDHPGFMKWLAETVYPSARAPVAPKDTAVQRVLRGTIGLVFFALAVLIVGSVLKCLLDFTISLAHDL